MTDLLRPLLETRSTLLVDVEPDPPGDGGERLLVRSDATGTLQLQELDPATGRSRRLTDLPDPVADARYVPGRRAAVLEVDRAGDERHQLYLLDLDAVADGGVRSREDMTALTDDPRHGHHLAGVARDGSQLAFTSNRRNSVDFDLWVHDLATGAQRCCYDGGGWCHPAGGFSPDGRWVSVLRPGPRPLDTELLLVEVATGQVRPLLEHPDEAAEVGAPAWVDERRVWVSSNVGRDLAAVEAVNPATGAPVHTVASDAGADLDVVVGAAGRVAVVLANRDGAHELAVHTPQEPERAPVPVQLPEPGVVADHRIPRPRWSADGRRLYFTLSTPRVAGDVWVADAASGATRRLTTSSPAVGSDELTGPELHRVPSFDGEEVPVALYRPPAAAGALSPVVVVVHGGPESQATRSWNPVVQGLVAAGYAVVVPNVRGSTGYGKRYASLDDTTRRLDSVADLGAIHDWLPSAGLDPGRAALWGGSYGGYMVLAGVAFQPERWAAGVDIVGISDLVTFLEHTSEYRRAHREREYGSLAHDREFLAAASPLRSADAIRAPLFVIHGRNDPRVPVSEAEQLVAGLRRRDVRCELMVFEDEGHGLARLANRLEAYPRAVAFLDEVLRPG